MKRLSAPVRSAAQEPPSAWSTPRALSAVWMITGVLSAALLVSAPVSAPVSAQSSPDLDGHDCASCHQREAEAWRAGPHATAHERLSLHQQRDPHCQSCHDEARLDAITRGAFSLKSRREVKRRFRRGERGVGCVSCHAVVSAPQASPQASGDSEVVAHLTLRSPSQLTCQRCHALEPTLRHPLCVTLNTPSNVSRVEPLFVHGTRCDSR